MNARDYQPLDNRDCPYYRFTEAEIEESRREEFLREQEYYDYCVEHGLA